MMLYSLLEKDADAYVSAVANGDIALSGYAHTTGEYGAICYKVGLVDRAVVSNSYEANTKAFYSRFGTVISVLPLVVF